jgi:hypothetical protein
MFLGSRVVIFTTGSAEDIELDETLNPARFTGEIRSVGKDFITFLTIEGRRFIIRNDEIVAVVTPRPGTRNMRRTKGKRMKERRT